MSMLDWLKGKSADSATGTAAAAKDAADVKAWFQRIDQTRRFDDNARKQYARDRRYARGDSGFDVSVNLLGTFIDILTAFLYAQDPEVEALPAQSAQPPTLEALMQAAIAKAGAQRPPPLPNGQPNPAAEQMVMDTVRQEFEALRQRYEQRERDNKAFGDTVEIVVSRLWQNANLKRHAKRWVRSALTIGVGWMKASWQTRTGPDPIAKHKAADLHANIARVTAMRQRMEDSGSGDLNAQQAEYEHALGGVASQMEKVIARGFLIELVEAEDMTVEPGVPLTEYLDACWISHRTFMRRDDAMAEFKLTPEQLAKAVQWGPRKPVVVENETALDANDVSETDADQFICGSLNVTPANGVTNLDMDFVRVEEIYLRIENTVLTGIEGLETWAKPAYQPDDTSRLYPFFLLPIGELDGQRHPQSLVARSYKLADEYNRVRSAFAEHRRRVKPKTTFNRGLLSPEDAAKLEAGETAEMVGVSPIDPKMDLRMLLVPVQYPQLEPGLYETNSLVAELERIWGVQEALSQAIQTRKTATEAQVQQMGFQVRTGSHRNTIDDMLSELAVYTAEVALIHMTDADAQQFAGPDAFWPTGIKTQDLAGLVNLSIRAGSTGKPNTTAERQAWTTLLPLIQGSITQIGQLRGSTPQEVSDRIEALMHETFTRAGEKADPDRFIPRASPATPNGSAPPGVPGKPPPPPQPIQETALAGPQTAALVSILADVKTAVISPEAAQAAIKAAFPAIPEPLVIEMTVQSKPPLPALAEAPHNAVAAAAPLVAALASHLASPSQSAPVSASPPSPVPPPA